MSANDEMSYPIEHMYTTVDNIMSNASTSLTQHEIAWSNVQRYIDRFPYFMQGPVRAVLSAYEQRLRQSYEWQVEYAKALKDATDTAAGVEQDVYTSFRHNER